MRRDECNSKVEKQKKFDTKETLCPFYVLMPNDVVCVSTCFELHFCREENTCEFSLTIYYLILRLRTNIETETLLLISIYFQYQLLFPALSTLVEQIIQNKVCLFNFLLSTYNEALLQVL